MPYRNQRSQRAAFLIAALKSASSAICANPCSDINSRSDLQITCGVFYFTSAILYFPKIAAARVDTGLSGQKEEN